MPSTPVVALRRVRTWLTVLACGVLSACVISIDEPTEGSTVTLPSAGATTKVTVTGNASYTGLKVTVDGVDSSSKMVSKSNKRDEGDLAFSPGAHTIVASANVYCWYCTNKTSSSTQTRSFTVVIASGPGTPGGGGGTVGLSLQPSTVALERGKSGTTTASVTRGGGFTGDVTVTVTSLPSGVTGSALTIPAAQTSGTLTLNASSSAAFGQKSVSVKGTGPGGTPASSNQPLTVVVPRAAGAFIEASPAPYFNSTTGSTVNSLSGTFSADIKTGTQTGLPQPRAAVFRKGTTPVGQPVGFTLGPQSNLGGAGFCKDNTPATQPTQTRGVGMTSQPVGSNAQYGFTFLDLPGNANILRQMVANSNKASPALFMQPRVFFSPDCTLALVAGVNTTGPSNYEVSVQDLQTGNPPSGSCGWPIQFNVANAFSALVKLTNNQTQVEVKVDPGAASAQTCTYNIP